MSYQKIFEENNFTPAEQEFVKNACDTDHIASLNRDKIIAELILSRRISESTDKLIASNEKLSDSNIRYSKRILVLTWVLVGIGFLTIATMLYQIWLSVPSICAVSNTNPAERCEKKMPLFGSIKY